MMGDLRPFLFYIWDVIFQGEFIEAELLTEEYIVLPDVTKFPFIGFVSFSTPALNLIADLSSHKLPRRVCCQILKFLAI